MLEKTPVQFHGRTAERDTVLQEFKACGVCRTRFSGDARFCPYDGEPLEVERASEPAEDPLLGTVIDGRYEVQSVLGEGGMGTVYRVRHRILERAFALKALRTDLARDSDLGLRFIREAKAAASISHPSVVQITDFGSLPSGQPYFVMELLAGGSLSSLVKKGGPVPAARAVKLLLQMVEALCAAHGAGVVHRDLKPDNILVCPSSSGADLVKVLDFGLAKVAGQSRLTKKGLVFGTPHYMSPEQASGGSVDERTDVYALGVVMYEMFTGRVPFEADTFMGVLTKHLYVEPVPPSVVLGGTGELGALEQVTLRCLEKKPEKRYASMQALLADLQRITSFGEDGTLTVQPMELGAPRAVHRLADDLELPTADELRLALGRAAPGRGLPRNVVAGATIAGVLLVFVVALAAWRSRSAPASGQAAASAVARARTAEPSAAAPPPVAPPAAIVPRAALEATEVEPAASAKARPRVEGPSHSPTRPSARPRVASAPAASAETARKPSTDKDKMLRTEIIDPWSR